ncbi:MAG: energy transducer TonB [Bacteroidetes bacterium]|nr:energy transducer TonB [Bacteroidota bacterium]
MSRTPHTDKLFNESACLSLLALERYRDKLLDDDEKAMVEAHLRECPLCKDALEGLSLLSESSASTFITNKINTRLRRKFNYASSGIGSERKMPKLRLFLVPAAASVIILISIIAYFHYFSPEQQDLAMLDVQETSTMTEEKELTDKNKFAAPSPVESRKANEEAGEGTDKARDDTYLGEKDESISQDLTTNTKGVTGGIAAPLTAMTSVADTETVFAETIDDIEEEKIAILELDEEIVMAQQEALPAEEEVSMYAMDAMAGAGVYDKASSKSKISSRKGKHDPDTTMVFVVVEQMPEFPGGMDSLLMFLQTNLVFPKTQDSIVNKTSQLTFIIYEDGSIGDVKVLRSAGGIYDREAIRVVEMMPPWIPGKQRGKAVRVQYILPVKFLKE